MQTIIESYLAQYPSIQMVLDVHRDAVEDRAGFPAALTANIDGEEYARLMLVVGTDEGGLTHPRWQENLANALKLQALVNRSAPGLCRDIDLRSGLTSTKRTVRFFASSAPRATRFRRRCARRASLRTCLFPL